ncbi:MAG: SDR family NAD(P)-dependent oxidoreductase [Candidatus Eisenbacteria bacterium]|nr:SDR family NAD(P)-dependent oxidoreductase [Candidatus Eisenbacteria bacterium]
MSARRAWMTGAGRGIGRETARLFAENGWDLYLSSRTEADLEETVRLSARAGVRIVSLPLDVRSPDAVREAVRVIEEDGGGPDAIVLSAGVGSFASLAEVPPDEWDRMIGVNLTGAFLCMRAAIPGMIQKGSGRIVALSSVAARAVLRGSAAYSASKAGLVALANVAREELRGTGVGVSVVSPGAVASSFWDTVESELDRNRMIPVRRIAETILRLAEEPPGAVTEEIAILPPDGIL